MVLDGGGSDDLPCVKQDLVAQSGTHSVGHPEPSSESSYLVALCVSDVVNPHTVVKGEVNVSVGACLDHLSRHPSIRLSYHYLLWHLFSDFQVSWNASLGMINHWKLVRTH